MFIPFIPYDTLSVSLVLKYLGFYCRFLKRWCALGVPTFKIFLSEQAGRYIFCTVFHEDLKNVNFFKIGSCPSTPKLGLPCLLNFADQAGWAKLGRRGGLSDQKTEMGFIIRVEKLSFWESAGKIHDVAGTPNEYAIQVYSHQNHHSRRSKKRETGSPQEF